MDDYRNSRTMKFSADLFPTHRGPSIKFKQRSTRTSEREFIKPSNFGSCLLWVMSTEISVDIAVDIAVDTWSTVGRQSVDTRSTLGRQSVDIAVDSQEPCIEGEEQVS